MQVKQQGSIKESRQVKSVPKVARNKVRKHAKRTMELGKRICKKSSKQVGNRAGNKSSKELCTKYVKEVVRNLSRKYAKRQQGSGRKLCKKVAVNQKGDTQKSNKRPGNKIGKIAGKTRQKQMQNAHINVARICGNQRPRKALRTTQENKQDVCKELGNETCKK